MQTDNAFINFIRELIARLGEKSPKFFKVLRIIFAIPTVVVAIPQALKLFNVQLPQVFNDTLQQWVSGFAVAGFIFTFFTVKDVEKPAVKEKLPFTKTAGIILLLIGFSFAANAQFLSIMAPLKHRSEIKLKSKGIISAPVVTQLDSTFWDFRPTVVAAFTVQRDMSKSSILVGTEISLQHLKYTYPILNEKGEVVKAGRFTYDVALSVVSFADVNAGSTGAALISPGIMLSVLNGQYGAGWRYNTGLGKGQIVATFTVNFNN